MLKKLQLGLAVFVSLFTMLALQPSANAASGFSNPGNVYVYVNPDLSQSNMLISFYSPSQNNVYQIHVGEGICGGEPPCTQYSTYEPQNIWVNPGWCAGFRTHFSYASGATSTTDWKYYSGGSGGQSVPINPRAYYNNIVYAGDTAGVETYLVPHGYAGCVAQ